MNVRALGLFGLAVALFLSAACSPASGGQAPRPLPTTIEGAFGTDLELQDFGAFGRNDTTIIRSDDPRFPAALRVRYPADSASQLAAATADTTHGGAQFYLAWRGGPTDDAYLRYFVRFESGFDFVKGGKLPGLYGGRVTGGRKIPDGTNGFSTRYMWRAAGAGEIYAYLPTSVTHGTSLGRGAWVWPTDVWTEIQQHVKLNSPGHADGEVQVWLNGVAVFHQTGLTFRSRPDLQIDGLFFSTFFGGGDASWATPRDQFTDFADFAVASRFIED
jgi:hypothetical protein